MYLLYIVHMPCLSSFIPSLFIFPFSLHFSLSLSGTLWCPSLLKQCHSLSLAIFSITLLIPPIRCPDQDASFFLYLSIFFSSFFISSPTPPLPSSLPLTLHPSFPALHSFHFLHSSLLLYFFLSPSFSPSLSLSLSPPSSTLALYLRSYLQPVGVDSSQQEDHFSPLKVQLRLGVAAKVKHCLGHTHTDTHTKKRPHTHESVRGERKERGEIRTHSTQRRRDGESRWVSIKYILFIKNNMNEWV